jgi:shingomyelin synthase
MFITVLPVADEKYLKDTCEPAANTTAPLIVAQRVLKLLSGMGLSINGKHVYCGDYIYSGHTMSLMMGYLVIKEYSPRRWFLLHYTSMAVSFFGVVTLLLARGHYSIDVVIAYWITTRVWWMFHTMANNANLKEVDGFTENSNNYLKKMWWWHIFRYFECNVPVCLPREFGWPVPKVLKRSKPAQWVYKKLTRARRQPSTSENRTGNDGRENVPTSLISDGVL